MAGCPRLCSVHVLIVVASACSGRLKSVSMVAGNGTMKNRNRIDGSVQSKNRPPPKSQHTPANQMGME